MILSDVLTALIGMVFGVGEVYSLISAFPARCPSGWKLNGLSCYMAFQGTQPQVQAQEQCQSMDSNLVVPNSKAENDLVFKFYKETWPTSKTNPWLGCAAALPNDVTCIPALTGPDGYYTFVPPSTPDETCVIMTKFNHRKWRAVECAKPRHVICERPTRLTKTLQCSAINHAGHTGIYCLLDHTLSVTQVKSPMQCCIACFKDLNCHSFNLSGNTCQLNNVTISQVDQGKYLKLDEDCGYFEMKWA